MKKTKYFLIASIAFLFIFYGCQKIDHQNESPTIVTGDTSNVQSSSVIITGTVTPNSAPIQISGHIWSSTNQLPDVGSYEGKAFVNGLLPQNKIISNLTNLLPGKTYYIRGYAVSGSETVYGNVINFLTAGNNLALVNTGVVTKITFTSADIDAQITSAGNTAVTHYGFVWSKINQNPTTADSVLALGAFPAPASYTSSLSNLSPATLYYARAYVTNNAGINYGNVVSFTTLSNTSASVTTDTIIAVSTNSATAKGNIISIGSSAVTQYGHVWSSVNNVPTVNDSKTQLGTANAAINFNSSLTGLTASTIYYVRAYAINNGGISYGAVVSFTTAAVANNPAVVSTGNVSSVTPNSSSVAGSITDIGSSAITQYGHVWSSVNNVPTINDSKTQLGTANAAINFNSSLTGLNTSTIYYVRAYAINNAGISYGAVVTFTSAAVANNAAVVSTGNVSSVTSNSSSVTGSITDIGSSAVTQYGHVWSSVNNVPTVNDSKTQLGTANSAINFNSSLTGLTASTIYYVRAYAINNAGISYGAVVSFTTSSSTNNLPFVTSGPITSITYNSATAAGNITDIGSSSVTHYGHVWSSSNSIPTTADNKTDLGGANAITGFSSSLIGLQPDTYYWVRTYATNSVGTIYGSTVIFNTPKNDPANIIIFIPPANVTTTTATFNGIIINIGSSPITQYGLVWSTNTAPTINDNKTQLGSATGPINFTSTLTGLTPSTGYYVRAYAVNSAGIFYSTQYAFYTAIYYPPPSIVTGSISNITFSSATASGNITSTNNSSITQYGHVWSSTNNVPTTNDSKTQLGNSASPVNYSSLLTSLTQGTIYYLRAYAVNNGGIAYGSVVTFTTTANLPPSVTTGDPYYQPPGLVNSIVVFPGSITSIGSTLVTQHGHVWSKTSTTPTLSDNFNQLGAAATGNYNSVFSPNTIPPGTYYVRAYATNAGGVSYGVLKILTY